MSFESSLTPGQLFLPRPSREPGDLALVSSSETCVMTLAHSSSVSLGTLLSAFLSFCSFC